MISLNINVTKFDPQYFETTAKGQYITLRAIRKDDDYGRQWMVVQSISQEARRAGQQGEIVGHGKNINAEHNSQLIIIDINLKLLDKSRFYAGDKGEYLSCHLVYPRKCDGDLECDYVVCQDVSKEERLEGVRAKRIGIARKSEYKAKFAPAEPPAPRPAAPASDDALPPEEPAASVAACDDEYPF